MSSLLEINKEEHIFDKQKKIKHLDYGEWIEEPDLLEFSYKGYECVIKRVFVKEPCVKEESYFGGYLCGYVRVPERHPLFRKDWDSVTEALDCHGGITANECQDQHWIGFDCAHSFDFNPSYEKFRSGYKNELFPIPKELLNCSLFNPVYRNIEFCKQECISIVDQLIEKEIT